MKNYIIGALIIGVCILGGFALFGKTVIQYGASSGPDHYNQEYFYAGAILGGNDYQLAAAATDTATLTANDVCNSAVISWGHNQTAVNATMTLPTSVAVTSLCLPRDGMQKSFLFVNATASTATTTPVAGTLMILVEPEGQDIAINGGNKALFTMTRASSTEVVVNITEFIDAD